MNITILRNVRDYYVAPVSVKANLREQVKRSGRSQNRRLQKGLPL